MKLINASAEVTASYYDHEHNAFCRRRMTAEKYLDLCADEGCPEAVEAVPAVWIEEYIKMLVSRDTSYSHMKALFIHTMLETWRKKQKTIEEAEDEK